MSVYIIDHGRVRGKSMHTKANEKNGWVVGKIKCLAWCAFWWGGSYTSYLAKNGTFDALGIPFDSRWFGWSLGFTVFSVLALICTVRLFRRQNNDS